MSRSDCPPFPARLAALKTTPAPGLKKQWRALIDVAVICKIGRLSRSLMDFSKLVEVFGRNEVTFVSVTQSFNTTTSMGRLTLNILFSFAQFEREVTGERIRDKVTASRKRGIWMGGYPAAVAALIIEHLLTADRTIGIGVHLRFNGPEKRVRRRARRCSSAPATV